jgi:hypothetical protein
MTSPLAAIGTRIVLVIVLIVLVVTRKDIAMPKHAPRISLW